MSRIFVTVRVKPTDDLLKLCTFHDKKVELTVPGGGGGRHEFTFDHVFEAHETQESIFDHHAHLIDETLEGFNTTIFAYGQTGAGKTHTVSGPTGFTDGSTISGSSSSSGSSSFSSSQQQGLVIRAANRLFDCARKMNATDMNHISLHLSVLEIYNETLFDLLAGDRTFAATLSFGSTAPVSSMSVQPKLSIVDTPNGILIPGLVQMPLLSEEDAYQLLLGAHNNRVIAEHSMNRKSSRSHVIYIYYVTRTISRSLDSDPEVIQSKLHLVDLAGSERVEKTGSEGKLVKEANHINKSLTFLEQVVIALTQTKRDHIPYRQSKLTYCLKDSLGGNCKTCLIACIWPHEQHAWETLSTLRFAARMKNVENAPLRNKLVAKEPVSTKLLQQVESLKRELSMRDAIVGSDAWLPELTKKQRERTIRSACSIATISPSATTGVQSKSNGYHQLDGSLEMVDVTVHSLSHVRLLVGTLRAALWESCEQDPQKVEDVCSRLLVSLSMQPPGKIGAIDDDGDNIAVNSKRVTMPTVEEEGDSNASQRVSLTLLDGNGTQGMVDSIQRGHTEIKTDDEDGMAVATNGDSEHLIVSMTLNHSKVPTVAEENNNLPTFEEFVLTSAGAPLHDDYEAAKKTLSTCKGRQKQIITLLNKLKRSIDEIQEQLMQEQQQGTVVTSSSSSSNGNIENSDSTPQLLDGSVTDTDGNNLKAQLTNAKRDYRLATKELELCKAQVKETETLKKRAMAILLEAYDSSRTTIVIPIPTPPLPP